MPKQTFLIGNISFDFAAREGKLAIFPNGNITFCEDESFR
jgi:hypothetical protein